MANSSTHIQYKIRTGQLATRAVNLGGWLVSEYWMCYQSPLYHGVPEEIAYRGEYAVMKYLGRPQGIKQFELHRKTWITEQDIAAIAAAGFNTVRVTTGYWIVNDVDTSHSSQLSTVYAPGTLKYLDQLIHEWAIVYNLAVLISLHAHEGSQNGLDHSAPVQLYEIGWSNSTQHVQNSLMYASFIADRYQHSPAFLGLNLMNEPMEPTQNQVLLDYYTKAYQAIRATGNDCIIQVSPFLVQQGPPFMNDFMLCPLYYNVWQEWHVYYKWGWEHANKENIWNGAATYGEHHFISWTGNPPFIGEWSLATPDTIPLNDIELNQLALIQLKDLNKAEAGWSFWSWRHDDEHNKTTGWSMRQLLEKKIIVLSDFLINNETTRSQQCHPNTTTVPSVMITSHTLILSRSSIIVTLSLLVLFGQ